MNQKADRRIRSVAVGILLLELSLFIALAVFLLNAAFGKPTGFGNEDIQKFLKTYREADYFTELILELPKEDFSENGE